MLLNFSRLNLFSRNKLKPRRADVLYDSVLVWCSLVLLAIGFLIVTSASVYNHSGDVIFYAKRDIAYIAIALSCGLIALVVNIGFLERASGFILLCCFFLLILVLIIGSEINGAKRWLSFGIMNLQPAEFAKLGLFCYMSSYLARKGEEVRNRIWGFLKPQLVIVLMAIFLLMQPDFGTVIVIYLTTLSLLFISGAKLYQFVVLVALASIAFLRLVIFTPYRLARLTAYLDPWDDDMKYNETYQITNSLMAFGRGGYFGEGIGNSVQKLDYLPEAHTDFVFAILAEEMGYIGVFITIVLLLVLIIRALMITKKCLLQEKLYGAYLSFAIAIWFSLQTFINIGAAAGMLPTKGLTLPLISYGGSSLLVMTVAVAILIRIDFEARLDDAQAFVKGSRG
ncbi:putative lipid II flippase FtsW [Thorsellia anophelis]|uniref:Probable peptidoglycan glycosyltransferase FtsW n=1 Tax=Thorsellia anophelis DSM 18579 TaxID=1123402 RepID=A0A1H9ZD78_9GAMM|nr:putative lipid II flippase FtsW [Thorsellia anophelis]SES79029.1 cell division-specific peptidoglycan biosynthesis regulator FtsW [Thorsellia anophelis DSM 18579]